MNNKMKLLSLLAGMVLSGQALTAGNIVMPGAVNINKMAQNIHSDLAGKVVGYSFVINKNGVLTKTGSGGLARRAIDGAQAMSSLHRMQVASVNKTLTAVAVLQLLKANGLSINSPISPWLPGSWVQGFGVWNGLTFKNLLTHTSGFGQKYNALGSTDQARWDNDWDGMEFAISNGAAPGSASKYINMNFSLFRVIVPALWKAVNPGVGLITEANYDDLFRQYMQKYVFSPAGIGNVKCQVQAPLYPYALGYDVDAPLEAGLTANVTNDECGGHAGLHLSARNLAGFMAHLRYGSLLTPSMRALMDANKLGWQKESNSAGSLAGKYFHGGDWYQSGGREWHTCMMKYPQNVEAVLLVNSKINSGKYQCTILKDAFNNAI
jgi:CubicO group peptidase (beta-lactamase class C family)